MSEWRPTLWSSILARVTADTGAGGLNETAGTNLLTGFFNNQAEASQLFPYVTFNTVNAVDINAFTTGVVEVDCDMHVWTKEKPTDGDTDGLVLLHGIASRLYGDWLDVAGGTPSYGFHNHSPTLSGWTGDVFNHEDSIEAHEPENGVLHQVESFTILVSKKGA